MFFLLFLLLRLLIVAAGLAAIVGVLFLLVIRPEKVDVELRSHFSQTQYAHRGFHSKDGAVPENSLQAFGLAVRKGYGIELDVQLTRDGRVVVFHDLDLKRMCNNSLYISDCDYDILSTFRLGGTDQRIPLLEEVLEVIGGRVPVIIELKCVLKCASLCTALYDITKRYGGFYCVESFNPFVLRWFFKHAPHVLRGQLSMCYKDEDDMPVYIGFILKNMLMNWFTKPNFIAFCYEHQKVWSIRLIRRVYKCMNFAWTVRDEQAQQDYNRNGLFDSMIFEFIDPDGNAAAPEPPALEPVEAELAETGETKADEVYAGAKKDI